MFFKSRTINAAMEVLRGTMNVVPSSPVLYFPPPPVMRATLKAMYGKLGGEKIIKKVVSEETPKGAAHTLLIGLSQEFRGAQRPEMSEWCAAVARRLLDSGLRS